MTLRFIRGPRTSAWTSFILAIWLSWSAQVAWAQTVPGVIRIGLATGGVGTPVRTGGSSISIVYSEKALEEEFRKDGTRIEWVFFKGAGPALNEALVNKQLDLAWEGDLASIVHRANQVKTHIILGSGVRGGLYLMVPSDSSIRTIEDLRGKRVGVFKGTNLHLSAVRLLADHGLSERDLKLINLDPGTAATALTVHDLDATFGYVEAFMLREKGVARIIWSAQEDSYKYTRQAALLVSDAFADQYPQAVQRVVKVVVKYAHKYSDEKRRQELFEAWGKAEYPENIWREDFIGQPLKVRFSPLLDPFLVARYEDGANEAYRLKLIRSKPDIKSWFDRRYLNAALKDLQLQGFWPEYGVDGRQLGR